MVTVTVTKAVVHYIGKPANRHLYNLHRSSYTKQLEAAVAGLRVQQQADYADVAHAVRILRNLGLPGTAATTTQQQQQNGAGGQVSQHPIAELSPLVEGVQGVLANGSGAQRALKQQMDVQVGAGTVVCACVDFPAS